MSSVPDIKTAKKRQSMRSGTVVIQNTPHGMTSTRMSLGGTGGYRRSNVSSSGYGGHMLLPQGEASKVSKETVMTVKGVRGKEKKEMCDLNGRLASYMEKVKFLEATNKALAEECEKLRKIKGITGERIRDEYEDELKEAREALAEASKDLAPLQAKIIKLEDKVETVEAENDDLRKNIEDLQNQIEKLNQMLGEQEAETNSLRRTCDNLARDRDMAKKELATCRADNARIRDDLEAARTRQITIGDERDRYLEELEFIKETTDIEINELRDLLSNLQSIQPQIESMWKSEFQNVITDLQQHFDERLEVMTNEQQQRFDDKLAIIQSNQRRDNTDGISKSENKTLKSQSTELRRQLEDMQRENEALRRQLQALKDLNEKERMECDAHKADLQGQIAELQAEIDEITHNLNELQSSKLDLELEIACYKKLLDGEENKIMRTLEQSSNMQSQGGASLAGVISKGFGGGSGGGSSSQSSKPVFTMSQSQGRVQVTRTSKIAIQITEVDQVGRYICLTNSSVKEFDLGGWSLSRTSPKKKKATYTFGNNYSLTAGKVLKVFSYNNMEEMDEDEKDHPSHLRLLASPNDCKSWGHGNGSVSLCDPNGKERASSKIDYMTD